MYKQFNVTDNPTLISNILVLAICQYKLKGTNEMKVANKHRNNMDEIKSWQYATIFKAKTMTVPPPTDII